MGKSCDTASRLASSFAGRNSMGASCWSYWVPYQKSVKTAFRQLRREVFEKGQYHFEKTDEEGNELRRPKTLDALLELAGESGTHSILDIEEVADEPGEFATVAPLSEDELEEFFGTSRPTKRQVKKKEEELQELNDRWEARYLVVYEKDEPQELFFFGCSGD
jgi:hypothetical protein